MKKVYVEATATKQKPDCLGMMKHTNISHLIHLATKDWRKKNIYMWKAKQGLKVGMERGWQTASIG
jgi:hypothetical protein